MIYYIFTNLFLSILFFYLIDLLLLIGIKNKQKRWYIIHALANTFVVIYGFENLINAFKDPFQIIKKEKIKNTFILDFVIGLHIFHIISSFSKLRVIDWLHHVISCIIVGYSSLFVCNEKMIKYILFFLCGLPGGIDYYLLTMVKFNIIDKMKEKRINLYLNMCIRLPGILFGFFLLYLNFIYNPFKNYSFKDHIIILFIMSLNSINAIYFATDVCVNYGYKLGLSEKIKN